MLFNIKRQSCQSGFHVDFTWSFNSTARDRLDSLTFRIPPLPLHFAEYVLRQFYVQLCNSFKQLREVFFLAVLDCIRSSAEWKCTTNCSLHSAQKSRASSPGVSLHLESVLDFSISVPKS